MTHIKTGRDTDTNQRLNRKSKLANVEMLHIGEEGKEQRRFALRHLRDFGFGKSSMEEMIRDECLCLAERLRSMDGLEVDTKQLFNLSVMNILWRMISGSRYSKFL